MPTEENVVVAGRWEVGATLFNFQGLDRRTAETPNDVKIYAYAYDLEADAPYTGPLTVRVELAGREVTRFARDRADEETIYVSRETLPASGEYAFVAVLPDGAEVAIPFTIELADAFSWALALGLGLPVLLIFGLALLGRTRRGRARLQKLRAGAPLLLLTALASPARAQAPDCADPLSVNQAIEGAHGESLMIMAGMPPLWFAAGMVAVIVLTFLLVEWTGTRPASPRRRNIIRNRRIYLMFRSGRAQLVLRLLVVGLLLGLVYAGLFGSRARNITPVAVWTLWWAGLVFAVAFVGPVFCTVCPWDALANGVRRLSLGLTLPRPLRSVWPAVALFTLLTYAELGLGTTTDPRQTAWLGLAMVALAVSGALLFEKKAFCDAFCPVGRISGLYANFSPFEIRARNPKSCVSCTTEDCLHGNAAGAPCPTGISLKATTDATGCTWCFECVKACPRYNVALNLRPFAADLHRARPRADHAWLAIVLLALTSSTACP
ncbi:MAG: hypothetical protein R3F43_31875 [bacterium]